MTQKDSLIKQTDVNCLIVLPFIKGSITNEMAEYKLEEAFGLATTLGLKVIDKLLAPTSEFKPGSLLKAGKIEEIKSYIDQYQVELVYVDMAVSPSQQKNLEKALNAKVIDRTGLILEIFSSRARTKEGKLQVRLAQLSYQRSRLVKLWTHLERQRGGLGAVGGPGETQLEIDKRLIKEEISRIKKHLEKVVITRELQRKNRSSVPYPVVALVGYTNAGKSTLFNLLSGAGVLAEDKLFATLDPTMRVINLPSKKKVILSDTVGFIADLPTELIAAFRATLEEVVEATIILHVKDSSTSMMNEQEENVKHVIDSLGILDKWFNQTIHVFNKIDKLHDDSFIPDDGIKISALKNIGIKSLLEAIDKKLMENDIQTTVSLEVYDSEKISWLYQNAVVLSAETEDNTTTLQISISPINFERWKKL